MKTDYTHLGLKLIPLHVLARAEELTRPSNPKLHDVDQLMESLRTYGYINPIVYHEESSTILAGNGRTQAMVQMEREGETPPARVIRNENTGDWMVPVLVVDHLDEDLRIAYNVDDNLLGVLGLKPEDLSRSFEPDLLSQAIDRMVTTDTIAISFSKDHDLWTAYAMARVHKARQQATSDEEFLEKYGGIQGEPQLMFFEKVTLLLPPDVAYAMERACESREMTPEELIEWILPQLPPPPPSSASS